jgi:uncharacterized cupin superfamily protein
MKETKEHKRSRVIDPANLLAITVKPGLGSAYPLRFPHCVEGRVLRRMSGAAGLANLSVVLAELSPGAALSMPLWQSHEDEFFFVLEGEATLVTDHGEEKVPAGYGVGFAAGDTVGHQIVNRSNGRVRLLEIANIADGLNVTDYAGEDLKAVWIEGKRTFVHRDGELYVE